MSSKKYVQIIDNKAGWIFETEGDVSKMFAPNITLVDITDFPIEVRQGMNYDVTKHTFYNTPESALPTVQELADNQMLVMSAMTDLYAKIEEINSKLTVSSSTTTTT